jgi:hypothetical protein
MSDANPADAPQPVSSQPVSSQPETPQRQAPTFVAFDSRMLRRSLILIITDERMQEQVSVRRSATRRFNVPGEEAR